MQKVEQFPPHLFSDTLKEMSPSDWWNIVHQKAARTGLNAAFAKFLVSLHCCPASSASIERWFSTFGFVWSKTRNRLGPAKVMKLVKMYRALNAS